MAQVQAEPVEAQLLRGRVALYVVVGILVAVAGDITLLERTGAVAIAGLAAAYPLVATTTEQRLSLAAGTDVGAGFLVWILIGEPVVPLLVVLWGLVITAFLQSQRARRMIVGTAIAGEALKLPMALFVFEEHRILGETAMPGVGDLVVQSAAKAIIIVAAYQFLRLIGGVYVRAFNALRASAVEHSALIEDAPTAVLVLDGWTVEYANAEACRLFGVEDLTHLVSTDFHLRVHQSDVGRLDPLLRMTHRDPIPIEDLVVQPLHGSRRIVDAALTTVTFAGTERTQIALNDVTFRSEAQFALAESEELFRGAFADSATPFGISDLTGRIVEVNDAFVDLLGYTLPELLSKEWLDLVHPDDREITSATYMSAVANGGQPFSTEVRFEAKDGRYIPVLTNNSFITGPDGAPTTSFTQIIDLSAQAAAEEQVQRRILQQQTIAHLGELALRRNVKQVLHEAAEGLAQHLNSFVTGVFCVQPNGSLVLDAGLGWPEGSVGSYVIPAGSSEQMDYVMTHGEPFIIEKLSAETRFRPSDFLTDKGAMAGVSAQIRGSGAPLGVVGVWSDKARSYSEDDAHFVEAIANLLAAAIERAESQAQLEQLIDSKDQFLASVSHELRTPLTVVNGMAAELHENFVSFQQDEVAEFVRLIADQSRDMASLIEDLLVAARADIGAVTIKAVPVDVRRELESVLSSMPDVFLLENHVRHTPVVGDPSRIRQILRNLLTNASRYGGPNVRASSTFDGTSVIVSVSDNGDGIPMDLRAKIFEPYERAHSAKGVTGSVGLGLSVSRTLAELMGGSLSYRHTSGESVFDLTLPIASSPALTNVVSLDEHRAIS